MTTEDIAMPYKLHYNYDTKENRAILKRKQIYDRY